jgi:flagellar basal body rod protein FlgF
MASETPVLTTQLIGETAGEVWKTLVDGGTMSLSKLVKTVSAPRDLVMQAIGWLAREDKIGFEGTARNRQVTLR